jgi:hypothetical protein
MARAQVLALMGLMVMGLAGCGQADPLRDLTSDDRNFLFADSATSAAFMGQPHDRASLDCTADRMNQAYVLVDTERDLWIDSVRPSGVERHRITGVTGHGGSYEIAAKNGAGLPFSLIIERVGDNQADISWDGAPSERYLRCPGPPVR